MRVAVTGAAGFVGRWLLADLKAAGHDVVGGDLASAAADTTLDVTDAAAVRAWLTDTAPDAVIHLAAIALPRAAAANAGAAMAVTVGGTVNLLEAARLMTRRPAVLVAGSAEVYGQPGLDRMPLAEDAPMAPVGAYALSKVAQESIALAVGARWDMSVAVARAFNHTGPGQAPDFVIPALARRVADVAAGVSDTVRTGNLDVARDFLDVRDVVIAYRLLVEGLLGGSVPTCTIANIASGRAVPIRAIVETLCRLAGVTPALVQDPALVRPGEIPEFRGDASRLHTLTGWTPSRPLEQTLADVLAAVS
jgi:GDP-4-dehydro-6-deoxy-D-mannose reductase